MPFLRKSKKSTSRPYRKRKSTYRPRGRRMRMPRAPTGSFASRQETFSIAALAGQVYDINDISLTNLTACLALADLYQSYRITSVQWRLKPNFDTFAPGSGSTIPYLYFLYDKSGSLGSLSPANFEACGAKPVRVDDKTIVRKWRPTVRLSDPQAAVPMFRSSPWMPTHLTNGTTLNSPAHLGAVWYVSKISAGDTTVYDVDVTVTVQYKKPLVIASNN